MTTGHPAVLFIFLGGLCAFAAASPPAPRENIPVNSEVFMQPEYIEALDKELEREGLAALQAQEAVGASNSNGPGYTHSKKFASQSQRSVESPKIGPASRFSERVLYPAEILGLSQSKRNFDEIDRSGFSGFNKRNFDEIDRSGFSGFNKRNMDEIERSALSGFDKRNFDEIDRSGFSGFNKRNFDEIDVGGFAGFAKRNLAGADRNALFSGFNRKRNFDEIDRSGFSGFNKRNFDEIDRSGVPGFTKRSGSKAKGGHAAQRRR